jgi:hypothetical protein
VTLHKDIKHTRREHYLLKNGQIEYFVKKNTATKTTDRVSLTIDRLGNSANELVFINVDGQLVCYSSTKNQLPHLFRTK